MVCETRTCRVPHCVQRVVPYTVNRQVTRCVARQEPYTVCRMVSRCVARQVPYEVCRMVPVQCCPGGEPCGVGAPCSNCGVAAPATSGSSTQPTPSPTYETQRPATPDEEEPTPVLSAPKEEAGPNVNPTPGGDDA
jgi:hypothetical protein